MIRYLLMYVLDVAGNYPPRGNTNLRNIHRLIVDSPAPTHIRQALVYYMLKDVKAETHKDAAYGLAESFHLSRKYEMMIDGLWYMDRLQFAVWHLTPTLPT